MELFMTALVIVFLIIGVAMVTVMVGLTGITFRSGDIGFGFFLAFVTALSASVMLVLFNVVFGWSFPLPIGGRPVIPF